MLNSERKEAFIEWYTTQYKGTDVRAYKQKARNRLEALGEAEDKYGKDICEFSAAEIKEYIGKSQKSYSSSKEFLRYMKAYAEWCAQNKYCAPNASYEIISPKDIEYSGTQAESLFPGINAFADYLELRFRALDQMTIDNITRAACWLLYFGVKFDDLGSLNCSDYQDGVLSYDRGTIDFTPYPVAKLAIDSAISQTTIRKRRGIETVQNTEKIIKYNTLKTIARAVTCYLGKIDPEIQESGVHCVSASCIVQSGLFWRIKHSDADSAAMMATRYIYSRFHSSEKVMKFQMRQLDKDYRAWVPTSE